jgi:hypothetical protein
LGVVERFVVVNGVSRGCAMDDAADGEMELCNGCGRSCTMGAFVVEAERKVLWCEWYEVLGSLYRVGR